MKQAESEILSKIKNGDKTAYENVFREHYGSLCSFANNYVFDLDESQDIVQEFFFHIWINRTQLPESISLKAYFYTSVKNRCLNVLKHQKIVEKHRTYSYSTENEAIYEDELQEQVELHEKLRITIEQLPPERKKILILHKYEGLKYREIAEKLNISVKTVENQMGKALKFLRENISLGIFIIIILLIIKNILK